MTVQTDKRPAAITRGDPVRVPPLAATARPCRIVAGGLLGATAADLFMPIFSGRLVDALTLGASDAAGAACRVRCLRWIVALGLLSMVLRLTGLQAIVPFTR